MLTLLASIFVAAPPADTGGYPAASADPAPAIQVSLNNDGNYLAGGRADVRVQTNDDGYLLVLRVDGDGQVRVLFPLDPDGDTFVRGGKEYELRGRDDRQTFMADDRAGNGLIYAAISHEPFVIGDFSANGHWDYNALRLPDSSTDAENDLTQLVAQMTSHARFEYDAVGYRVQDLSPIASMAPAGDGYYPGFYDPNYDPAWRCLGCGWAYPGSDIFFGLDFGYSPFYDPYLFSPWAYNYGYRYGGGFFPGTFPVIVGSRPYRPLPPGTRARPRATMPMPGNGSGRFHPSPSGGGQPAVRGTAPSGPVGTRARPRPSNEPLMPSRMPYQQQPSSRPIFREPPRATSPAPQVDRRPVMGQPESRPVYREPPRPSSPPPSVRVAPPPRSAPPPSGGGARSRPSGGGGGGGSHGGGGHRGR